MRPKDGGRGERVPYERPEADGTGLRFRGTVSYDGTDFGGWQTQPHGNTIQDILEVRLQKLLACPVHVAGSGRTDAGGEYRLRLECSIPTPCRPTDARVWLPRLSPRQGPSVSFRVAIFGTLPRNAASKTD